MDKPLYRGTYHCFQSIIRQESVSGNFSGFNYSTNTIHFILICKPRSVSWENPAIWVTFSCGVSVAKGVKSTEERYFSLSTENVKHVYSNQSLSDHTKDTSPKAEHLIALKYLTRQAIRGS